MAASAQVFTTTTVQGTVYLADGRPGSGTLQLSWPAFTTANNQAVTAGRTSVTIGADGYVSVKLAPNQGSSPAGLYYTAVYHLSDGTTSTEYWTVPAAAQASLAQVRAQVMPAAQAVQTVSKSYVDQSIAELTQSLLTASGGSLSGPLFLAGDPTQPTEAATKRYVDREFGMAVPLTGAVMSGPLTSIQLGAAYQVDQFAGADFGARLQACVSLLDAVYGGTCDARNFSGAQAMSSPVVIATANATVQLPCATITTASPIQITAGTRNVTLHGCALRGASDASGSKGGTVFLYSGNGPMIQVGDATYTTNTLGFHLDNAVINTTPSANAGAQGLAAYRTQEMELESLYLLGNSNQTGITLDGTGNYTGGTFQDIESGGFGTALNAIGHQVSNAATTDWLNASTFISLHINCPTSGGNPVAGTYGINLLQGDGNTFTGGDVEGCATALHLGPNAQNNTIVGLRNENSGKQVVADAGSSYNSWMTGGTMFTGQLTDNGTRNSFLDTFHRSFNSLNGDWYGSQQDATVTNHFRIGTGAGNERGLLNRYQSDYGYRWTTGLSDATAGEQFYQVLDELNSVYRLSIGQYNNGQSSTNNQTVINAAGTGAVVLNGSANSGTGGVIFGAGGSGGATVATINNAGNAQFNGSLQVSGPSTFISTTTVKNQADAEIDSVLWAGTSASQKESFIYKDYTGASQWYMVKDASNNWALNSATGGLDSFKAYQSNNSGDTYVNASKSSGHIRLNYETGSGTETDIYSGSSSALVAAFLGSTAIKFPGLAASSGHNCMQIDNSGYITNTGSACGTGGGGVTGTVNTGSAGQVAYYDGNGTVISGMSSVAVGAGGTGASTASQALANLGGQPAMAGVGSDGASGLAVTGNVSAGATINSGQPVLDIRHPAFAGGGVCDNSHDIGPAIQAALNALPAAGGEIQIIGGATDATKCYWANPPSITWPAFTGPVTFHVQGYLRVGTTLTWPTGGRLVHWMGLSGSGTSQFQGGGQTATIALSPNSGTCTGTLGTDIPSPGSTGTAVAFTPSTMGCLVPGAAITVAGTATCSITSLSRAGNIVTAGLGGSCHIPPGAPITITGVADSSFNGTYNPTQPVPRAFLALTSDYVQNRMTWTQTGPDATSGGGAVTGFNEDTIENVWLSSCGSTTCTATFYRTHSAADQWGVVAMAAPFNANAHLIKDIMISNHAGTSLWLAGSYLARLENVGIATVGFNYGGLTNFPLEFGDSSFVTLKNIGLLAGDSPWGIRLTRSYNLPGSGSGPIYIEDSALGAGIKLDHGASGVSIRNTFIEQATRAAITIDPTNYWNGNQQIILMENSGLQDNGNLVPSCLIYYTTPVFSGLSLADVSLKHTSSNTTCEANDYFMGAIHTEFQDTPMAFDSGTPRGPLGVFSDGKKLEAEVRGEQAEMAPALIPFATLPVTTSPSSWSGSCTVTPGVLAPDGTLTAGRLTAAGAGGVTVETYNVTPTAGDMILYGGWAYTPTTGKFAQSGGGGDAFALDNFGSSHFSFNTGAQNISNQYDTTIVDDWWHPVVAFAQIASADGAAGSIRMSLGCDPTRTMDYWQPFMMYIPASANIPLSEVLRWRQQLVHGYVPPGAAAGQLYSGYAVNLPGDPALNNQAATKHYVDAHPPTYTLPAASTTTLGGVKCDGSTTTCGADGTIHASVTGGGVLLSSGGQTLSAADTLSGLPPGCLQLPCVVGKVDRTGLAANASSTTAYSVPAGGAGWYRVGCYEVVATAGTGSPALPQCYVVATDADTGNTIRNGGGATSLQIAGGSVSGTTVGNTNIANNGYLGGVAFRAAASTNITYSTNGYAAGSGTPMQYSLHLVIEYLGP